MIERYSLPEMSGIWTDENRFQKMLDVEIAACEAFVWKKQMPKNAYLKIKKKASFSIKRINEIEAVTNHDVIAFLTAVGETVGKESRYIHKGMTSSDVLDTALSLQLKDASDILIKDIKESIRILKKAALKYRKTIMMGRTHGIHAEPITFGFKVAGWYEEMKRNLERMKRAKEMISVGKISGVVGTFAHQPPEVEAFVCRKLGIVPDPVSSQVVQRDRHADFMTTLAVIAASIEKFAVEIRHLQRTEVREAEEFFSKGQKGSSAMPHKRNPIICERLTGMARLVRTNALAAVENVALWHERDISHSSVERIILPDTTILLDYMFNKFNSLVDKLKIYPENMMKNLQISKDVIFSQRILLALIGKGISREDAYALSQRNAMKAWKGEGDFRKLMIKDGDVRKLLSEKEINACFDIKYFTRNIDKVYKRLGLLK